MAPIPSFLVPDLDTQRHHAVLGSLSGRHTSSVHASRADTWRSPDTVPTQAGDVAWCTQLPHAKVTGMRCRRPAGGLADIGTELGRREGHSSQRDTEAREAQQGRGSTPESANPHETSPCAKFHISSHFLHFKSQDKVKVSHSP